MLTIAFVHRGSIRDVLPAAGRLCAAAALFVVPFLVFLALNGGIGEYSAWLRYTCSATLNARAFRFRVFPSILRDRCWRLQVFSRRAQRLSTCGGESCLRSSAAIVRSNMGSRGERRSRERRGAIASNVSRSNIEALVRDPLVDDTSGIDRAKFAVVATDSIGLETQLDSLENATAFLYYAFLALPFIAAAVLMKLQKAAGATRVMSSMAHMGPLLGLAVMLSAGFMSRGVRTSVFQM